MNEAQEEAPDKYGEALGHRFWAKCINISTLQEYMQVTSGHCWVAGTNELK